MRHHGITTRMFEKDFLAGFLMYLPLYKRGSTIDTVEERRKALVRFAYSPFSLDAFEENTISHKKILISIDNDGEYGTIVILDNAGGMSAEIVEKVFLPYFTTKSHTEGTGLGLYMSKMIIEGHCHGLIHAHSENEYAVFTIKLPLENEQ